MEQEIQFVTDPESDNEAEDGLITFDNNGERVLKVRLGKWLWAARFFKTRAIANEAVEKGRVYYNGERTKPSREIEIGALLQIRSSGIEWTVVIRGLSTRRRSINEAMQLFEVKQKQELFDTRQPEFHPDSQYPRQDARDTRSVRFLRRSFQRDNRNPNQIPPHDSQYREPRHNERYYEPNYNAPQYNQYPDHQSPPRYPNPRYNDNRYNNQNYHQNQRSEPRYNDSRQYPPRYPDQRYEPRYEQHQRRSRYPEQRNGQDYRYPDHRGQGMQHNGNSSRYSQDRYPDHRGDNSRSYSGQPMNYNNNVYQSSNRTDYHRNSDYNRNPDSSNYYAPRNNRPEPLKHYSHKPPKEYESFE